jgi:hypothetical protein
MLRPTKAWALIEDLRDVLPQGIPLFVQVLLLFS